MMRVAGRQGRDRTKGKAKEQIRMTVTKRRSERIAAQLPVIVEGKPAGEGRFREPTRALLINAHGALISLTNAVTLRQKLTLSNPASQARQECSVVYLGDAQGGRTEVGVEFTVAAPQFWQVQDPPASWKKFLPTSTLETV
jgi:hypothetical protein